MDGWKQEHENEDALLKEEMTTIAVTESARSAIRFEADRRGMVMYRLTEQIIFEWLDAQAKKEQQMEGNND